MTSRWNALAYILLALSWLVGAVLVALIIIATSRSVQDGSSAAPAMTGTPHVDARSSATAPGGVPPTYAVLGAMVEAELGTVLVTGTATWYCSASSPCTRGYGPSDMVAAIDPTLGIDKGDRLTVCHDDACITVTVVDVCACRGQRVVDLTSGAFRRLAPLSAGVIPVTLEYGGARMTLPPTDLEGD